MSPEIRAAFMVLAALVLAWSASKMARIDSLEGFMATYRGGVLGGRLRIIHALMGERIGTLWIRAMGVLGLAVAVSLAGAAVYVLVARPMGALF